jgi:FixJ family two-component response regulator
MVEFMPKPFSDNILLRPTRESLEHSRAAFDREAEMPLLRDCYASLTRSRAEVMALAVSGLLNKLFGGELGVSKITVKQTKAKRSKR